MEELIEDGRQGLQFNPGDAEDLAAKVAWAWEHANEMESMGRRARQKYQDCYAPDANYSRLMEIYGRARDQVVN